MAIPHQHRRDQGAAGTKRRTRQQRAADAIAANREELSLTRRNMYDSPDMRYAAFRANPRPPSGGSKREELEARIGELRAGGMSYLNIACEVNHSASFIRDVCQRRGFTKDSSS
jgi:hypothetical protein